MIVSSHSKRKREKEENQRLTFALNNIWHRSYVMTDSFLMLRIHARSENSGTGYPEYKSNPFWGSCNLRMKKSYYNWETQKFVICPKYGQIPLEKKNFEKRENLMLSFVKWMLDLLSLYDGKKITIWRLYVEKKIKNKDMSSRSLVWIISLVLIFMKHEIKSKD